MKNKFSYIAFFTLSFLSVSSLFAQSVQKGTIIVDAYYGFGSLNKAFLKSITNNSDASLKSLGPIGARFEYMASDRVGIGFDFNYTDNTVTWVDAPYNYNYNVTRIRFMPRFNYHFGSSDKFDAYLSFSAGYRSISRSYTSNDPDYDDLSTSGLIPIATRLGLGARYFFTDNIGLGLEFGLGGGYLLHPGISVKF